MWVCERLGPYVHGDLIVLPDGATVSVSVFESLFAEAIAAGGSYEAFVAADFQQDAEGNVIVNRGYRHFFDHLKAEGILK